MRKSKEKKDQGASVKQLGCEYRVLMLWFKTQVVKSRNNSCIGVTQENSIEFLIQSSLSYILLLMVHANYCTPYPK